MRENKFESCFKSAVTMSHTSISLQFCLSWYQMLRCGVHYTGDVCEDENIKKKKKERTSQKEFVFSRPFTQAVLFLRRTTFFLMLAADVPRVTGRRDLSPATSKSPGGCLIGAAILVYHLSSPVPSPRSKGRGLFPSLSQESRQFSKG